MDVFDKTRLVHLVLICIAIAVSVFNKDTTFLLATGFYLIICELVHLRRDLFLIVTTLYEREDEEG